MSLGTSVAMRIAGSVLSKARSLTEQSRFDMLRRQMAEETVYELEVELKRLASRIDDLPRAHADASEAEQLALIVSLLPAAQIALTGDRRKMLVNALVGLASFDFSAEERSRVARTIMQLEPSDVVLLRAISQRRFADQRSEQERAYVEAEDTIQYDSLLATGCITQLSGAFADVSTDTQYRMTSVGKLVLAALLDWRAEL